MSFTGCKLIALYKIAGK